MTPLAAAGARPAVRFAAGEPILISGEGRVGAFVAVAAAGIGPVALRRLGELGGEMPVLLLADELADRIGLGDIAMPIDAAACGDGGWSLADRALTIRQACAPGARPADVAIPGHVPARRVDSRASVGLVAALELAGVAGRPPAVVVSAVLDAVGEPVPFDAARCEPRLREVSVVPEAALAARALARALDLDAVACGLPTRGAAFTAVAFASAPEGDVTIALVHGDPASLPSAPVHAHTACLFGDVFASSACACHGELQAATDAIVRAGAGVILYTKPALAQPFSCPRRLAVDMSVAVGLLRRAGVSSLTLSGGHGTLSDELATAGFELGELGRMAA